MMTPYHLQLWNTQETNQPVTSNPKAITVQSQNVSAALPYSPDQRLITNPTSGEKFFIENTMNCQSENTVYIIACRQCGMKYVGTTKQTVKECYHKNRNEFRSNNPKPLYRHFRKHDHRLEDLTITPIQQLTGNEDNELTQKQLTQTLRT